MAASLPAKRKNERYYKNPTTISARALAYLAWVIRVVLTARPSLPVYFDNRTSRTCEIGRADFARWPRFDRRKSYRDAIAIARPARFDFFRPGRSDIVVLGWTRIAFFLAMRSLPRPWLIGLHDMDWPDYLRDQAAKYRQLAEQTDDPVIKNEMLELAAVCEEVANNIEDNLTGG
jgi:hypothetical protein